MSENKKLKDGEKETLKKILIIHFQFNKSVVKIALSQYCLHSQSCPGFFIMGR